MANLKYGGPPPALLQILLLNGLGALLSFLFVLMFLMNPPTTARLPELDTVEHQSYLKGMRIIPHKGTTEGLIPDGGLPVSAITILPEKAGWEGAGGVYMQNNTTYQPDYEALLRQKLTFHANAGEAQVLLYHTHTTEAYSNGLHYYLPEASTYSKDNARNIVAVGETLSAALERAGIHTIHETTQCDDVFNKAYGKSLQVAQAALEAAPGVQLVVDMHRDSMITEQGVKYRPLVEVDGLEAAQLMLVVGSPQSGLAHDGWQNNLATAMQLYLILEELCPGIVRPIHISTNRYNQHISPHALLIEVGSCANTLEQAQLSAEILAEGIAKLLITSSFD